MNDVKNKIKGKFIRFKRWIMWMQKYIDKKYWVKYKRLDLIIKAIFKIILIILLVIWILFVAGIIDIKIYPIEIRMNNLINISDSIIQQLVIAQISSTFLITAVLSLVANLENVYIYGEKARNNIFKGKLITFSRVFIILISLMFFSISMMIKSTNNMYILISTIGSLFILSLLTFKMIRLFLQKDKIKQELKLEYYKENIKVWRKSIPGDLYFSLKLINLRERYLFLMFAKDIEYVEFNQIYLDLVDKLLFNNRSSLQEYYTEPLRHNDLIADYVIILENMIKIGEIDRAIQYYNNLLEKLNYYNTYIPYIELFSIFEKLNVNTYNLQNMFEIRERVIRLSYTARLILEQAYICNKTDFSYTRVGKLENSLIRNVISSDIFADIYDSVYNKTDENINNSNNYLQIYDEFRMSSFYLYNNMNDITNFSYKYQLPIKRERDISVIGTVVASLLLKTLKNNDEENFKLFLSMNINQYEMLFAYHILVLSVIQAKIEKYNENQYSDFYNMDLVKVIDTISKNNYILKNNVNKSNLEYVWNSIKQNCTGYFVGGYRIDYRFNFKRSLVKAYFNNIKRVLKVEEKIISRAIDSKNIIVKETVEKIYSNY
ncbi:hypothetical protein [uncultured Clostridium sp.]|uniref:hypothetical protein n=1 Tax=uncultured Clostridium sp. TaxID=59620 RepID=UPI002670F7D1|nr:hypothetical protein [uncultured Clostridium sp.]